MNLKFYNFLSTDRREHPKAKEGKNLEWIYRERHSLNSLYSLE